MKPLNEYRTWLQQLTDRIHSAQVKAALKVNEELIPIYWHPGQEILDKEKNTNWGNKLIDRLSKDLLREFPHLKGFSRTNLYYVRQWVLFHNQPAEIVQQLVGQFGETLQTNDNQTHVDKSAIVLELLTRLPWGHHVQIISKCRQYQEALFYIIEASKNNWSRNVLVHQVESGLWNRRGKAITNFVHTLPAPHSDLARELIKDPYNFDFLNLYNNYKERDLESALMDNLTRFLLELGTGFSFVGRQYSVKLGTKEYNIDLLFYHFKLHCFVVVELKSGEFLPEHAGN